jgi:alpha-ketoglutarate-dependent taurine dioxygenase
MHILKSQCLSDEELLIFAQGLSNKKGELKDKLLHWEFGPIMEMRFDHKAKNYLFSDEAVPLHWDGAFYQAPEKLLFYCTESEGHGGETIFVDTELLWRDLSPSEKEQCQSVTLTYKTQKLAHYGGEIQLPLVQTHPSSGAIILRMAEEVNSRLNPVSLTLSGPSSPREFYEFMVKKLYDPKYMIVHRWERGDLVISDNYTYLHGRRPLGKNKKMSFKRIQIL